MFIHDIILLSVVIKFKKTKKLKKLHRLKNRTNYIFSLKFRVISGVLNNCMNGTKNNRNYVIS